MKLRSMLSGLALGAAVVAGLAAWIVLPWPVLLALILVILLFGCYGEGFDSAAFLYTNF